MRRAIITAAFAVLSTSALHSEDFHGRNCIDGCPDLKAGYQWAQEQDIHDPYQCLGRSREYQEGCNAAVLEAGPKMPPNKKQDSDDRDPVDPDGEDQGNRPAQ